MGVGQSRWRNPERRAPGHSVGYSGVHGPALVIVGFMLVQLRVGVPFPIFLAIAPMFVWDLVRSGAVHGLWDSEWWHSSARRLVGVERRPPTGRGAAGKVVVRGRIELPT